MLKKAKSKKGFTLAELLIAVAIVAVLTAIAVPLFVGSLNRANEETFEYNQKAVKSMGIAKLLTMLRSDDGVDVESNKTFYAYAIVKDGNIDYLRVISPEKGDDELRGLGGVDKYEDWAKVYGSWKGGCVIYATITFTDLYDSKANGIPQKSEHTGINEAK